MGLPLFLVHTGQIDFHLAGVTLFCCNYEVCTALAEIRGVPAKRRVLSNDVSGTFSATFLCIC